MPTGLTIDVSNDFLIFDNLETCSFNQMTDAQTIAQTITGVVGFGNREEFSSVEGLEQIIRNWKIRASDISAISRVNCLDQLVDSSGVVWIITRASLVVWKTQWDLDTLRLDCLISICGTTTIVEQGTSVRDNVGGYTTTFTALYSSVPIRIVNSSSHQEEEDGQQIMVNDLRVWTIQPGIQIGQRLKINGVYYRIMGTRPVLNRAIGSPIWYEVDCQQKTVMTS